MRVLFLSPHDSARQKGGGAVFSRAVMDIFRNPPLAADVLELAPRKNAYSLLGTARRAYQAFIAARSLISPLAAKSLLLQSREFIPRIKNALTETRYDVVVINSSQFLWAVRYVPERIPVILLSQNIESRLYRSQIATLESHPLIEKLLLLDCKKMERDEIAGVRRINYVISVSSEDMDYFKSANPDAELLWLPPTFSYPPVPRLPRAATDGVLNIGFLARFDWWPNRDGARWFLENVLPKLGENIRLHLFGPESQSLETSDPRVRIHGFVPDIADVWRACDFTICPISSGGGVNVKLAESLYNSVPVLATTFATRGLDLPADPAIAVRDGAKEWIAFLNSPAAGELARRKVPESLARMFDVSSHVEPVQDFVRRAARSRK